MGYVTGNETRTAEVVQALLTIAVVDAGHLDKILRFSQSPNSEEPLDRNSMAF
jgi:hypothetical protein